MGRTARAIFRPYRHSSAERSDRSAGDRQRHRQKVRDAIRDNIADIVAEEAIIGQSRDKVVKVPIRGVREFRFVYGPTTPGVAEGDGNAEPGQIVGRAPGVGPGLGDRAGDRPGQEVYETEISLEELIDIMFEDLELPDLERRALRQIPSERLSRRKGFRSVGIRARLDKRRTARERIRRLVASRGPTEEGERPEAERREPFHVEDLTYRHVTADIREESNAVVLCIMDTSGSMGTLKKYLARSLFFLLYQFIRTRYRAVELVFIAHHTEAREVTEDEFFHRAESGGTFLSSGYQKALEIIEERYHPSLWNVYAFHCSDGDNFDSDNPAALRLAKALADVCNLFGYCEIKPIRVHAHDSSMLHLFRQLDAENFQTVVIERKEDVWPSFRAFLAKDRGRSADPPIATPPPSSP